MLLSKLLQEQGNTTLRVLELSGNDQEPTTLQVGGQLLRMDTLSPASCRARLEMVWLECCFNTGKFKCDYYRLQNGPKRGARERSQPRLGALLSVFLN
jgi:hypothetical protein